jgi:hypothetical protein
VLLGGPERLACPLMLTCMGCFYGEVCISDLFRLATLAKLVIMSGCLEAMRSYNEVGPLDRLLNEPANKTCQRLVVRVDRGSGLESDSVSESRCSGESTCRSLRR